MPFAPETTETSSVKPSVYIRPELARQRGAPDAARGASASRATLPAARCSWPRSSRSWVTGTTVHADGGALAAGGFYRTPSGAWTNTPIVTGDGFGFS